MGASQMTGGKFRCSTLSSTERSGPPFAASPVSAACSMFWIARTFPSTPLTACGSASRPVAYPDSPAAAASAARDPFEPVPADGGARDTYRFPRFPGRR
jgi:hypothetical protein